MVPVETWRLVLRNPKTILKWWIARLHRGLHHIVLMADGGNRQPVKVQIRRYRAHDSTRAGTTGGWGMNMRVGMSRSCPSAGIRQCILQVEDNEIARIDTQIGGFPTRRVGIAIAGGAICVWGIANRQLRLQDTVLAAQVLRFFNRAADQGTRTYTICRWLSA